MREAPVIRSLLEVDWYKFMMGNFAFLFHRGVRVRYAFKNRHAARVHLPDFIRKEELRGQIAHARSLAFTADEIAFLRESPHIPKGLLSEGYLAALRKLRLPPVRLAWSKGACVIETEGAWHAAMLWETLLMNIVNQLYFRELARKSGRPMENIWDEGARRLMRKVQALKKRPHVRIVDFGLRRSFDLDWCDWLDGVLRDELGDQLAGISNVRLAMKHGKPPSGTCAHEMFMVRAGLDGATDEGLRASPTRFLREWYGMYGAERTVAIPDTFGTESFIEDLPRDLAERIHLYKIDSGDPKERGMLWARTFPEKWGIDPRSKRLIFCDGLDVPLIEELDDAFAGKIGVAPYGPGTHLTNDVGFDPISIVVKASAVERGGAWVPLVKLSDNLDKASGPPEEIERYVRVFRYGNAFRSECRV